MRARLVGCLLLAVIGTWFVAALLVLLAAVTGGPAAVGGPPAWIAAIGTALVLLFLVARVPWVPHRRSGEIEVPLLQEQAFDSLVDFQRSATISGLRSADAIYLLSGDELVRDRQRLVVGGAVITIRRIKAERPGLVVTNLRAAGQNVTTTRRLSPTEAGSRIEVEESGRLGLAIAIANRRVPQGRWLGHLEESIMETAAAKAE